MGNNGNQKGEPIYMNKKEIEAIDFAEKSETPIPIIATVEKTTVESKSSMETMKETMVYVGPTIIGVAVQNTFFNNGIPDALKAAIADAPIIGNLLIPISKLPMALKEIENKQGAMHIYIQNAKQYKPKKGA
jgi:hypothetical protein